MSKRYPAAAAILVAALIARNRPVQRWVRRAVRVRRRVYRAAAASPVGVPTAACTPSVRLVCRKESNAMSWMVVSHCRSGVPVHGRWVGSIYPCQQTGKDVARLDAPTGGVQGRSIVTSVHSARAPAELRACLLQVKPHGRPRGALWGTRCASEPEPDSDSAAAVPQQHVRAPSRPGARDAGSRRGRASRGAGSRPCGRSGAWRGVRT